MILPARTDVVGRIQSANGETRRQAQIVLDTCSSLYAMPCSGCGSDVDKTGRSLVWRYTNLDVRLHFHCIYAYAIPAGFTACELASELQNVLIRGEEI